MKKLLIVTATLAVSLFASYSRAETTLCKEITSLPAEITDEGVYCLKKDLVFSPVAGFPSGFLDGAINIKVHNVTLDMNGFTISNSVAGPANEINGIVTHGGENNIIRNGGVTGFKYGILNASWTTKRSLVENMRIHASTEYGIYSVGSDNVIRNNIVTDTGPGDPGSSAGGIAVVYGTHSVVENNIVSGVTETDTAIGIGTTASGGVKITGNSVFNIWGATNKQGIVTYSSHRSVVQNNHVIGDGDDGIIDAGFSSNLACIRNVIGGYSTAVTGCTTNIGNISY